MYFPNKFSLYSFYFSSTDWTLWKAGRQRGKFQTSTRLINAIEYPNKSQLGHHYHGQHRQISTDMTKEPIGHDIQNIRITIRHHLHQVYDFQDKSRTIEFVVSVHPIPPTRFLQVFLIPCQFLTRDKSNKEPINHDIRTIKIAINHRLHQVYGYQDQS